MLVTDRRRSLMPLPILAARAAAGGIDAIQIRERDLSLPDLLAIVIDVRDAVVGRAAVLVNGDVEVARRAGVGLHLPANGAGVEEARSALGPHVLVGRSIHGPASVRDTAQPDYVIAGHVFETTSKPGIPPLGLDGLREIVATAPCPVLAIGGIDARRVGTVLQAGAHGVAVISAINNVTDPYAAARRLRHEIDRAMEQCMESASTERIVTLTINGKEVALAPGTTISAYLATKGLTERMVVVELNGTVLPRSSFASTILNAGDRVEMVHAVGGG